MTKSTNNPSLIHLPSPDQTTCPRRTPWCTEHEPDADQCVSSAVRVAEHCHLWLLAEAEEAPRVVVDAAVTGDGLTLDEAGVLAEAVRRFQEIAGGGERVSR